VTQLDIHGRGHRLDRHRIPRADRLAAALHEGARCSTCGRRLGWSQVRFTDEDGTPRVIAFVRHVGPLHVRP